MKPSDLGLTIRELLRYGYGGLLFLVAAAIIAPARTKSLVDVLGPALTGLAALAIGVAIYAFYRPVIGQVILHRLAEAIHRKLSPRWGYDPSAQHGYTCRSHLLEECFSVARSNSLNAYRLIRDSELHDPSIRKSFHTQHSEISVLQLTLLVLVSVGIISLVRQPALHWADVRISMLLIALGVLSGASAVWGDIQICSYECAYLMTLDAKAVAERLERAHLSQGSKPVGSTANPGAAQPGVRGDAEQRS